VEAAPAWPRAAYFAGRILPRYLCEPPEWARSNTETLQGLLGFCDFGPMARPFAPGESPYGGNMAVRRFFFNSGPSTNGSDTGARVRVLGEETALFARARQQGLEGIWIPAAEVTNGIPPEQLTPAAMHCHFRA
jgi:hypothetical protein